MRPLLPRPGVRRGFLRRSGVVAFRQETGGDESPAELDNHVEVGGLGLGAVPGSVCPSLFSDLRSVAVVGVPDDHQSLGDQPERDGAGHGGRGAVAGLADAGNLTRVFESDLDRPAGWVAGHDVGGGAVQVGGDQGQVVAGLGGTARLPDQYYSHGAGAVGAVPQAHRLGDQYRVASAVAVHAVPVPYTGAGQVCRRTQPLADTPRASATSGYRGGDGVQDRVAA